MNKFNEILKDLRLEKGLTRKQLANFLSVSDRLVSFWENGQSECGFDILIKIALLFNVSIDYLLGKIDY